MTQNTGAGARLMISGTLEFKDAAGNVLERVQAVGSLPLEELGLSEADARALIETQTRTHHGIDHRE